MKDKIKEIEKQIDAAVSDIQTSKNLMEIKMKFLGKTGEISTLMKNMRDVPAEERPSLGKVLNALRQFAEERFASIEEKIKKAELKKRYAEEKIDVTMPGKETADGAYHPNTLIRQELISIFSGMGFEVFEGPEIENEYYNFTALNTPDDHPARDMQDTFYLSDEFLLRTQTSAAQIRVMEGKKPPIKILSPGRVFRSDDDATHSPMFHQMEGLVVEGAGIGNLHNLPQVHDHDAVGHILHHRKVVGNKQVGQPHLLLHILQHIHNLRLDGNIQSGNRLVTNDKLRFYRQSPGNPHTLLLAAGKLMGITVGMLCIKPYPAQQLFNHIGSVLLTGRQFMNIYSFAYNLSYSHTGIQGCGRILKNKIFRRRQEREKFSRGVYSGTRPRKFFSDAASAEAIRRARRRRVCVAAQSAAYANGPQRAAVFDGEFRQSPPQHRHITNPKVY